MLVWVWAGAATSTGFRVRAKIVGASARLAVSTSAAMASPVYVGPVTPTGEGVVTFDVSGLQASLRYYYAVEVDGVLDVERRGTIRTAPAGVASFRFAAASCAQADHPVFDRIRRWRPDFFVHMGDLHYQDIGPGVPAHRSVYDTILGEQLWQPQLYRSTNLVLCVDDHEIANDVDASTPGVADWQQVYREVVPHYPLPSPTSQGVYQAFTWGRLRVIVTDVRTERSPKSAPDNADKRTMSADQEAWFRAECLAAKAAGQAICWVNTYAWIQVPVVGGDKWGGYTTARSRLADFFAANDLGPIMFIISGDAHMLAIDDGSGNHWGGFPVFQFAALNSSGTEAGGPYSHGKLPGGDQFGVVKIEDFGEAMTVTGTGISAGEVWKSHTFTIPLPSVPYTPPSAPQLSAGALALRTSSGAALRA